MRGAAIALSPFFVAKRGRQCANLRTRSGRNHALINCGAHGNAFAWEDFFVLLEK